jgi:hypothetical protein
MTAGKLRVERQMLDGGSTITEIATTIGAGEVVSASGRAGHQLAGFWAGPLYQAAAAVMAMQDTLSSPRTT